MACYEWKLAFQLVLMLLIKRKQHKCRKQRKCCIDASFPENNLKILFQNWFSYPKMFLLQTHG